MLVTWRYSDIVVNPSSFATRAIETASSPSASAIATAVSTIASTERPALGPRVPPLRRPHSRSRPGGRGGVSSVGIGSLLRSLDSNCMRSIQFSV